MSDTLLLPWRDEPALAAYAPHLGRAGTYVEGRHRDYTIRSAFQPIFSFAHGRAVGFEGLARAWDRAGKAVPPPVLLASAPEGDEAVFLDRLLRALHTANFSTHAFPDAWLFLNVSPEVVVNGRSRGPFFKEMLRAIGMPPHRVVVEVTESETADEGALEEAAHYYKKIGCLLAIDDFGAGHSNFQRIWRLKPDIIKLDRLMISQAARDPAARRSLVGIAALLHEIGALVLAEGIETEAEAVAALQAEVDLLQGYLLQRPFVGDAPALDAKARFGGLREALLRQVRDEETFLSAALQPYLEAFKGAAQRVSRGEDAEKAVGSLLEMPRVLRCYFLETCGTQVGGNLAGSGSVRVDPKYRPLTDVRGANWMHRHYCRRAISNPDRTQVSRPYLSITDPGLCLTLSRALPGAAGTRVLCCDLVAPSL
jgi:EAL domain-containing protein (putative c-di-GMP-specific phosphodiesterase class I)